MATYLRISSALVSMSILTACAATVPDVKPKPEAFGAAAPIPGCLTQTGSHIAVTGANCLAIGSSYSDHDISQTGATTPAEALRLMDPTIISRH